MKRNFKRAGAVFLATAMAISSMPMTAAANPTAGSPLGSLAELASKTNRLTDRTTNRYEVTVSVPGAESELYNEMIIMVDNSGSQSHNFNVIKDSVRKIGESVLNSSGNMKVTLMSFGLAGYNVIEKASTNEELNRMLSSLTRGDFYDGIGATNCEAGFTHIQDYIEDSPNLNKAYVFYVSDGEANASDEPLPWDAWDTDEYLHMREKKSGGYFKWNADKTELIVNLDTRYTVEELVEMAMKDEIKNFYHDGEFDGPIAPATEEVFGADIEEILEELQEEIDRYQVATGSNPSIATGSNPEKPPIRTKIDADDIYKEVRLLLDEDPDGDGVTRGKEWIDLAWEQAYELGGLTIGEPCAYSAVERAFTAYDTSTNYVWLNHLMYTTYGYKAHFEDIHTDYRCSSYFAGSPITYKIYYNYTKGQRAATEAIALSEYDEVETLYLIGMGSSYSGSMGTSWMNASEENKAANDGNGTAKVYAEGPKIKFELGGNMDSICDLLETYAGQIATTPYNDVSVTDYMSKWVTLVPETIKIYDGNTVICKYNEATGLYEWEPGVTAPTAKTPITVEYVAPEEYAAGGPEVMGNKSGDIYKITWNIKDGALVTSDDYHLRYDVIVDTAEEHFEFSEYLNGMEKPGTKPFVSNGNTDVHYTDADGELHDEPIEVPYVDAPDPNPGKPEETTPAETTPVETTPEETTPEETTPVETTPVETTPAETTPVETTPIETSPVETEPEYEPEEEEPIPAPEPAPVNVVEIDDNDTPLGAFEIEDNEIPMGVLPAMDGAIPFDIAPATGTESSTLPIVITGFASLLAAAYVILFGKKKHSN